MTKAWVRDTISLEVQNHLPHAVDFVFDCRAGRQEPALSDDQIRERYAEMMRNTISRTDSNPDKWYANESIWAAHTKALDLAFTHDDANPIDRAIHAAESMRPKIQCLIYTYRSQFFGKPSKHRLLDKLRIYANAMLAEIQIAGRPPGSVYATTFLNRMATIIMAECKDY